MNDPNTEPKPVFRPLTFQEDELRYWKARAWGRWWRRRARSYREVSRHLGMMQTVRGILREIREEES